MFGVVLRVCLAKKEFNLLKIKGKIMDKETKKQKILKEIKEGGSPSELAKKYNISRPTIYRWLREKYPAKIPPSAPEKKPKELTSFMRAFCQANCPEYTPEQVFKEFISDKKYSDDFVEWANFCVQKHYKYIKKMSRM